MKKILLFTAPAWCAPCRALEPLIDELSQTYPIEKINIDSDPERQFKHGVRGVPTILVFEGETEKHRIVGLKSKQEYIKAFEN